MPVIQQIEKDLTAAQLNRDAERVSVLRLLKAALKNKSIEKIAVLTDEEELAVLKSEKKKRQDSRQAYLQGNRPELAAKEEQEIKVIDEYLPPAMDESAIRAIIEQARAEMEPAEQNNFGKVMAECMKRLAGQADGRQVGDLIKQIIQPAP